MRVMEELRASQRGEEADDEWVPAGVAPHSPRIPIEDARVDELPAVAMRRRANRRRAEEGDEGEVEGAVADERQPEEAPIVAPTVNLLGWRKTKPLTASQLQELNRAIELDEPEDGIVIGTYRVKRQLFDLVERRLRECKRYKVSPIPATTGGSVAQQLIWKSEEYSTSRHTQHIQATGVACSRTTLPLRIVTASKVMCYRTLRREWEDEEGRVFNPWACFDFDRYRAVPNTWVANRNSLISRGGIVR
ncbi:unnamed protein product, partial [Brenthis ino]